MEKQVYVEPTIECVEVVTEVITNDDVILDGTMNITSLDGFIQ